MDILALLTPAAATPTEGKAPAAGKAGAATGTPTDAFAAVFAAVAGDNPVAAAKPLGAAVPDLPITAASVPTPAVPAVPLPTAPATANTVPTTPVESTLGLVPATAPVSVTTPVAPPVPQGITPDPDPNADPGTFTLAPESPPKILTVPNPPQVASPRGKFDDPLSQGPPQTSNLKELEAPTPAPNAPVKSLDQTPKGQSTEEDDSEVDAKDELNEPNQAMGTAVPQPPMAQPPFAPALPTNAITNTPAPASGKVVEAATGIVADPTSNAIVANTASNASNGSEVANGPANPAAALPDAPDLGLAPVAVVNIPAVPTPVPAATPDVKTLGVVATPRADVPNARIAKVSQQAVTATAPKASKVDVSVGTASADDAFAAILGATASSDSSADGGADGDASGQNPSQNPTPAAEPTGVRQTSATERPEEGKDRATIDRHLVVRQVADRIENLAASRPRDGVTVHLEPKDLGTVTLIVKGAKDALDVSISASDERVRQSLDASRPELAQALAPRGLEIRSLRFDASAANTTSTNAQTGGDGARPGSDQPSRRGATPNQNGSFSKPASSDSSTPARAVRRSGRGVDLLV